MLYFHLRLAELLSALYCSPWPDVPQATAVPDVPPVPQATAVPHCPEVPHAVPLSQTAGDPAEPGRSTVVPQTTVGSR